MSQTALEKLGTSPTVGGTRAPSLPSRLVGGSVALFTLAACGAAGLALWEPGPFLAGLPNHFPRALLLRINLLPHIFTYQPEYALVLWWLIAAGVLLAVTARGFRLTWEVPLVAGPPEPPSAALPGRRPSLLLSVVVALVGLAQVAMWISLRREYYHPLFAGLWLLGLAAPLICCWRWNRAAGVRAEFPFSGREGVFLAGLCIAFTVYCGLDLTSWRY